MDNIEVIKWILSISYEEILFSQKIPGVNQYFLFMTCIQMHLSLYNILWVEKISCILSNFLSVQRKRKNRESIYLVKLIFLSAILIWPYNRYRLLIILYKKKSSKDFTKLFWQPLEHSLTSSSTTISHTEKFSCYFYFKD